MRTILSWLLIVLAAFFALTGLTIPLMLPSQVAKDRVYYAQFRRAAAYVDAHGHLPTGQALDQLRASSKEPVMWPTLIMEPLDCDPSFAKARSDRFVLSFWRGEWSECYAHPSGTTTLATSVKAYLLSGLGLDLIIYWLIAAAAGWAGLRIRKASTPH